MKRLAALSCALLIAFTTSSYATPQGRDFTEREKQQHINKILETIPTNPIHHNRVNSIPSENFSKSEKDLITPFASSFISMEPIRYIPNYTRIETEAFPLTIVGFNNLDGNLDKSGLEISYNSGHTVAWSGSISGNFNIDATIPIIRRGLKGSIGVGFSGTSTTNKAVGAKTTYNDLKRRKGYIPIYAPGVATGGAVEYKWKDVTGKSGVSTETNGVRAIFPLDDSGYKDSGITFGRPVYQ